MRLTTILLSVIVCAISISSCGPDEQEQNDEKARQDSLEQVRNDSLRQQRQDSLAKVQAERQQEQPSSAEISFSEDGRFALQVESWRSRQKAQSRAAVWRDRGFQQVSVVQYGERGTGDVWFRVRLGRMDSREAASELQQQLEEDYQASSWIETL